MRNTQLGDKVKIVNAVVPSAGAVAAMTAIAVDGSAGFDRVMFVLSTGAAAAGATLDLKITSSATSGGAYADVAGAAITQLAAATGASKQFVIDMPVADAKPFFKVSGAVAVDTFANSTIAILYKGANYPVSTAYATQIVTL